jgi:DNA topoisomerase-1
MSKPKLAAKIVLTKYLVIVESPAKCKKIESYLGSGYKVVATYGHLRNITDLKSINIDSDFAINWSINKETLKQKQIELLRSEIGKADEVIIATDSDREGEAIAWHICDLFNLNVSLTKRIVFNEITETAILAAVKAPTRINMDLVNAQKTRQIIDMLVGFTISPFLWKHISRTISGESGLSAGRCQTPALRLIYDNYKAIQDSPGKKVYNTTGCFTNMNLTFDLNTVFTEPEHVTQFLNGCKNSKFICNASTPKKSLKKPPEPLTTSSLQQLASNELHMSPKDTMKYAQQLYEGGYITYMRTDSKKYSKDFVEHVKMYIEKTYDKTYISQNIDALISSSLLETKEVKDSLAQEAHEAIRPVSIDIINVCLKDEKIDAKIDAKSAKLYALIWKRSLESCMPSAQYNVITAKINLEPEYIFNKACEFVYKAEQVCFAGFHIIDIKPELLVKEYQYFASLKPGAQIIPKKINSLCAMHDLTGHYSEAHLVKLLEDNGIGRPSTFASLIDKIQERDYVKKDDIKGTTVTCTDFSLLPSETKEFEIKEIHLDKEFGNEKGKLVIQPIGIIVIELLIKHFDTFFNYEYTKVLENELDAVAKNGKELLQVCTDCKTNLQTITKSLIEEPKFSLYIDDNHEIIIGKFGPVIKSTISPPNKKSEVTFIPLKKEIDINNLPPNFKLEDLIEPETTSQGTTNIILGKYKGEDLYIKKGKYGLYVKWGLQTKPLKELGNRPIENVNYIEVLRILDKDILDTDKPIGFVRELSATISIRTGKFGDYIFYKKPRVKNPQFLKLKGFTDDYKKCNKDLILNWIKQTYGAE